MTPAHAEAPDAPVVRRRCALVVGNGDYRGHKHMVRLKHPPTDARAVAFALQGLGFTVHLVTNADAAETRAVVEAFREDVRQGGALALVYYSGHGLEVSGRNYLVPADWPGRSCGAADLPELSAQGLLDALRDDGAPYRIVIVDACRLAKTCARSKLPLPPLQERPAQAGELLFFATSPQAEADDSPDFRKALVKALRAGPERDVRVVFEEVRRAVSRRGHQEPRIHDALPEPPATVVLAAPPL